VLDKTERENAGRRKRKQNQDKDESASGTADSAKTPATIVGTPATQYHPATPKPSQPGNIPNVFTPPDLSKYVDDTFTNFSSVSPEMASSGLPSTVPNAGSSWLSPGQPVNMTLPDGSTTAAGLPSTAAFDFSVPSATAPQRSNVKTPVSRRTVSNDSLPPQASPSGQGNMGSIQTEGDPLNLGAAFQHPFVPQDLWQMPMTLEWDWAGMTNEFSSMEGVMSNMNGNGHDMNGSGSADPSAGR